jgi:hypothetical protein
VTLVGNFFKRVRCQCSFCGTSRAIPRRRILRLERFFEIEKGQSYVWECHDCCRGVVIPEEYTNSHGENVNLVPTNLPEGLTVLRF